MKPKVLVILGPTASGKTSLSIELAKRFSGEVISADSRQVYTGLDIGTGKVTAEEMGGVPHHMLDVADAAAGRFSVADFVRHATPILKDIHTRGHLSIIAGGTGFYIEALLSGADFPDAPPNEALRAELEKLDVDELHTRLAQLDPRRASNIDNNPRRIIRAIELATALGSVPERPTESIYNSFKIGIELSKELLHERIHTRLHARMKDGMLEEVQSLHAAGLSLERLDELGLEYRYLAKIITGEMTEAVALEKLETEIKKYAKRQMTWWRRDKNIHWYTPEQFEQIPLDVATWRQ